jgi:hypothetical protein
VIASLVVLGLILLFLAFSVSRSAKRSREAAEARQRREEAMREQGGGEGPFAGSPFGSIFDQLFSGAAMRSRSLTYDPETGQWVDITDEYPQGEEPAAQAGDGDGQEGERPRRAPQQQQRQSSAGPLGGLFGSMGGLGGMMGGSGNFSVEPPSELDDFDDVGGMEPLKQEVRDTVGLVLEHPDDAERYGI